MQSLFLYMHLDWMVHWSKFCRENWFAVVKFGNCFSCPKSSHNWKSQIRMLFVWYMTYKGWETITFLSKSQGGKGKKWTKLKLRILISSPLTYPWKCYIGRFAKNFAQFWFQMGIQSTSKQCHWLRILISSPVTYPLKCYIGRLTVGA